MMRQSKVSHRQTFCALYLNNNRPTCKDAHNAHSQVKFAPMIRRERVDKDVTNTGATTFALNRATQSAQVYFTNNHRLSMLLLLLL